MLNMHALLREAGKKSVVANMATKVKIGNANTDFCGKTKLGGEFYFYSIHSLSAWHFI